MSERERDRRIAAGYNLLLSPELRLAHQALLAWAGEMEPDGWPTPTSVTRFAAFYGVSPASLGALFGLLSFRAGGRTVWCDEFREPGTARRAGLNSFGPSVAVPFGIFLAADAEVMAALH
jgi:hypothetical protein